MKRCEDELELELVEIAVGWERRTGKTERLCSEDNDKTEGDGT